MTIILAIIHWLATLLLLMALGTGMWTILDVMRDVFGRRGGIIIALCLIAIVFSNAMLNY